MVLLEYKSKVKNRDDRKRREREIERIPAFNAQSSRIFINYQNRLGFATPPKRINVGMFAVFGQTIFYFYARASLNKCVYTRSATARRRIIIFIYAFISDFPAKFSLEIPKSAIRKKCVSERENHG